MKLYVDGCSWTWGAEIEKYKKYRYSTHLEAHFGEVDNFSQSASSNFRIARQVLATDMSKYDIAFVQMTFPARLEWFNQEKDEFQQIIHHSYAPGWTSYVNLKTFKKILPQIRKNRDFFMKGKTMKDVTIRDNSEGDKVWGYPIQPGINVDENTRKKNEKLWKDYYKYIYQHEFGEIYETMFANAIRSHCKAHNTRLVLSTIRGMKDEPWYARDAFDGPTNYPFDFNMEKPKYPRMPMCHPTIEGHKMIADDLIECYENIF